MCGEKPLAQQPRKRGPGSPPHVRGKVWFNCNPGSPQQDHPRMCGEKTILDVISKETMGSPPHVRGKEVVSFLCFAVAGITPACAGKSETEKPEVGQYMDHPRMCGEKLSRRKPPGNSLRITPACAGKRLKRSRSTVPHAAIVPLFPSVCNKPAGSDGSPAGHDAPPFLPIENAAPASPAYNLRSL